MSKYEINKYETGKNMISKQIYLANYEKSYKSYNVSNKLILVYNEMIKCYDLNRIL